MSQYAIITALKWHKTLDLESQPQSIAALCTMVGQKSTWAGMRSALPLCKKMEQCKRKVREKNWFEPRSIGS